MIESIQNQEIKKKNIKNKISQHLFNKDFNKLKDSQQDFIKKEHLAKINIFK